MVVSNLFSPLPGELIQFDHICIYIYSIFSNGLKPATRKHIRIMHYLGWFFMIHDPLILPKSAYTDRTPFGVCGTQKPRGPHPKWWFSKGKTLI